jgi:glutaredoxin 2
MYSDALWKMKKILKVNGHNEVPRLERQMQSIAQRSVLLFSLLRGSRCVREVKLPPRVLPDVMQRRSQQAETKSLKYILLPYINTVAVTLLCSPLFIISAPLER